MTEGEVRFAIRLSVRFDRQGTRNREGEMRLIIYPHYGIKRIREHAPGILA